MESISCHIMPLVINRLGGGHTCTHTDVTENSNTVWLLILVGLIFRGLGSSDDFVGLYFHGVSHLIT